MWSQFYQIYDSADISLARRISNLEILPDDIREIDACKLIYNRIIENTTVTHGIFSFVIYHMSIPISK